jgi:hypothetical protein
MEERCTVCAKRTIGSGITWVKQMVLLGDKVQVEAHFGPLGDNANFDARLLHDCAEHAIGSKINLHAPDGTLRLCGSCQISFRSVWRRF